MVWGGVCRKQCLRSGHRGRACLCVGVCEVRVVCGCV